MKNPIIENRIVNDKTFATRLKSFLKQTTVADACSDEEKEYLLRIAEKLLDYQIATCPADELWYHENCGNLPTKTK